MLLPGNSISIFENTQMGLNLVSNARMTIHGITPELVDIGFAMSSAILIIKSNSLPANTACRYCLESQEQKQNRLF